MAAGRVLIADDDSYIVTVLTKRCRQLGLEVTCVSDGATALESIRRAPPDLVLLDVNMPAGDGLSVCQVLATDQRLAPIPVIILTGRSDEGTIRRCEELGAHYVLKDPDAWDSIRSLLAKLLHLASDAEPPGGTPAGQTDSGPAVAVSAPAAPATGGPTVLVIDDDHRVCKAVEMRLSRYGVRVLRAYTGMQGYWMALKELPQVVILDYRLPEGHGNYILRRLKEHSVTRGIPVFVVTGGFASAGWDYAVERELFGLGASELLAKPIDFDLLLTKLQDYLNMPQASPATGIASSSQ